LKRHSIDRYVWAIEQITQKSGFGFNFEANVWEFSNGVYCYVIEDTDSGRLFEGSDEPGYPSADSGGYLNKADA